MKYEVFEGKKVRIHQENDLDTHYNVATNCQVLVAPSASESATFVPYLAFIPTDWTLHFTKTKCIPFEALEWVQ